MEVKGDLRGNGLHIDTRMFLVRIERKPISTKVDLASEPWLKALHGFNCASGSFLDTLVNKVSRKAGYIFTGASYKMDEAWSALTGSWINARLTAQVSILSQPKVEGPEGPLGGDGGDYLRRTNLMSGTCVDLPNNGWLKSGEVHDWRTHC